jgi:hypothetical protein
MGESQSKDRVSDHVSCVTGQNFVLPESQHGPPTLIESIYGLDPCVASVNRPEFPGDFFAWISQATLA